MQNLKILLADELVQNWSQNKLLQIHLNGKDIPQSIEGVK